MQRRSFLVSSVAGAAALGRMQPLRCATPEQTNIPTENLAGPPRGPWRRLFLDAATVEQSHGLDRVFHSADPAAANPLIVRDEPWEGVSAVTGPYVYGTVFWEAGRLRMWYQLLYQGNHIGYAESKDGVHWTKPRLGIIEFNGNRQNNLVVSAFQPEATGGLCHNPSVIRRPGDVDPRQRYALFGFDSGPRVAFSPDGLHWKYPAAAEALFASSDVVNFAHDPYQERYFATWKTRNRRGRAVGIAWSADGLRWNKPFAGPVFTADDLDPDDTQIYGMPAFAYQGLYLGLPWIYHARYFRYGDYSVEKLHEAQSDSPRTMDVQLAWSWDLVNWTRPPRREAFLARGKPGTWDAGGIVTANSPVIMGDELWFYYGGTDGVHDDKRLKGAIGVARLRLDGFCSMQANDAEGWLITRREPFHEPAVMINARTKANGRICAEILDRKNRVVPGFSRDECLDFRGDSARHELRWKSPQFPKRLPDYKLRFFLQNAEIYSYLPRGLDPGQRDLARFPE